MIRVLASMVLWLAGGAALATTPQAHPVLILGDSLSAGYGISREASWPQLLGERLREAGYRHSVVNASISGETTSGGARRVVALLDEHHPAVVVVALGANDGLRGIAPDETRRNLARIVDATTAAGAAVVLVRIRIPPNYGPQYSAAFEAVYDDLGARGDVVYAPFLLERFALDRQAFQRDGLHPTAAAQPDILETLWPSIREALATDVAAARS